MIDWGLIIILTVAMICDFATDKIPNEVIYIGISGWLLMVVNNRNISVLYLSGVQVLIAFAVTYPLFKIGALGAGDIKLFMTCACYLCGKPILPCIFISFVIGAVLGIIKLWEEDIWAERFYYFTEYIGEVVRQKKWMLYEKDMLQNIQLVKGISRIPKNRIHFSLSIFLGVVFRIAKVY